jgi:hypothetical protein
MPYDDRLDRYRCPAGRCLSFHHAKPVMSENERRSELRICQGRGCAGANIETRVAPGKGTGRSRLTGISTVGGLVALTHNMIKKHGNGLKRQREVLPL